MIIRKIGITETAPNVWRVTYDGHPLGDSRGYDKAGARREAALVLIRSGDGKWQGSQWVEVVNVPDTALLEG